MCNKLPYIPLKCPIDERCKAIGREWFRFNSLGNSPKNGRSAEKLPRPHMRRAERFYWPTCPPLALNSGESALLGIEHREVPRKREVEPSQSLAFMLPKVAVERIRLHSTESVKAALLCLHLPIVLSCLSSMCHRSPMSTASSEYAKAATSATPGKGNATERARYDAGIACSFADVIAICWTKYERRTQHCSWVVLFEMFRLDRNKDELVFSIC